MAQQRQEAWHKEQPSSLWRLSCLTIAMTHRRYHLRAFAAVVCGCAGQVSEREPRPFRLGGRGLRGISSCPVSPGIVLEPGGRGYRAGPTVRLSGGWGI